MTNRTDAVANTSGWAWVRHGGDPGPVGEPRCSVEALGSSTYVRDGVAVTSGVVAYRDQPMADGERATPYDVTVTIGVEGGEVVTTDLAFHRRPGGPPVTVARMQACQVGRFITDAIELLSTTGLEGTLGTAIRRHYATGPRGAAYAEVRQAMAALDDLGPEDLEHVPDGMTGAEYLSALKADLAESERRESFARSMLRVVDTEAAPKGTLDREERARVAAKAYLSSSDTNRRSAVQRALDRNGFKSSPASVKETINEARHRYGFLPPAESTRPR